MANDYFQFRQFTVHQGRCAMKVGTDGVLLGAWADTEGAARILDIGTGSGLIALMLAQRSDALIDAVEVDAASCDQARENILGSPWKERITVFCESFQHYAILAETRYDLVVSNPPFFRNSLKPPEKSRATARHDTRLSYAELLAGTDNLLTRNGRCCVILPAGEYETFTREAWFHRLYPVRRLWIRSVAGKAASRCMIELSRTSLPEPVEQELVLHTSDGKGRSAAYTDLTRDFYLLADQPE